MMRSLAVVCICAFLFIISLTSAGIFLNDEWMTAQQLVQLGQGHQITYNEGKYGYYENGTEGAYMQQRNGVLIYSIAYPLFVLPLYYIIHYIGIEYPLIFLLWFACPAVVATIMMGYRIDTRGVLAGFGILAIVNCILLFYFDWFFQVGEATDPTEVLAFVFFNCLCYTAFIGTAYLVTGELWNDTRTRIIGTIAVAACSSTIFWVGTLKDHVLVATLVLFTVLMVLRYQHHRFPSSMGLAGLAAGLTLWTRIDIGIGICGMLCIYAMLVHTSKLKTIGWTILSMLPGGLALMINNWIVTGNPLIHPTNLAIPSTGSSVTNAIVDATVGSEGWLVIDPLGLFKLLLSPASGAIGLLVILGICLPAASFAIMTKTRPNMTEITLVLLAMATLAYHVPNSGFYLQSDTGIIPDIRYCMFGYAPLVLASLSMIERTKSFNPRRVVKYTCMVAALLIVVTVALAMVLPTLGATYRDFNNMFDVVALVGISASALLMLGHRNEPSWKPDVIVAVMLAIPLAWQIGITLIYASAMKSSMYGMLLPLSRFIVGLIFGC